MNRARDTSFQLAHQQQLLVLIQGKIMETVQSFECGNNARSTGTKPGADRQILFQHHMQWLDGKPLLLQRFGIPQIAGVDDILLRIIRQLVSKPATAGKRESLLALMHLDPIPQQGTINGGQRRPQYIKSHAHIANRGWRIGHNCHLKPPASSSGSAAGRQTPRPQLLQSRRHSHAAQAGSVDNR